MVEPQKSILEQCEKSSWWETFFDEVYGQGVLERIDTSKTKAQVEFICRELNLKPGDYLFDQCCGRGRVSIPMASQGYHVIGVDCIQSYVDHASQKAEESNLECLFVCDDARHFVSPQPCDAAINWFTSFGYSSHSQDNTELIRRAYDSLKPGGMFALDYVNMAYALHNFKDRSVHKIEPECADSLVVIEESAIDCVAGMIKSDWTFVLGDGQEICRPMEVKMYMPHEVYSLLQQCGFEDLRLFGNVSGDPITLTTPRCICVGRKPL
ncbi:MAG: class I SAM-dependent methyltransferase [Phycisphaerales bacterium]|nr:class I SAM-dependent methyltransferase [Phycisphaerales bacterium]